MQFCSNNPDHLLTSAKLLEHCADAIDINFGCPQRIAKRGYYGAFLMDNLPLVERLVSTLANNLKIPVTAKIRRFEGLDETLAYAKMIEAAGASLVAVHGRTRAQKCASQVRANWDYIKAVKSALRIPVIANGNVRTLEDAYECMAYTGCDGVMSAESLLVDPALFAPRRLTPGGAHTPWEALELFRQYLHFLKRYPVHIKMVRGHMHQAVGPWLAGAARQQAGRQAQNAAG